MKIIFDEREVWVTLRWLLQEKYGADADSAEYQFDVVIIDLEEDEE